MHFLNMALFHLGQRETLHLFGSCKALGLQEEICKGHQDKQTQVGEQ